MEDGKEVLIAAYMYFYGTNKTLEGSYYFEVEEIIKDLPCLDLTKEWLKDHSAIILEELNKHNGILESDYNDSEKEFCVCFYDAYCGLVVEDDDDDY